MCPVRLVHLCPVRLVHRGIIQNSHYQTHRVTRLVIRRHGGSLWGELTSLIRHHTVSQPAWSWNAMAFYYRRVTTADNVRNGDFREWSRADGMLCSLLKKDCNVYVRLMYKLQLTAKLCDLERSGLLSRIYIMCVCAW